MALYLITHVQLDRMGKSRESGGWRPTIPRMISRLNSTSSTLLKLWRPSTVATLSSCGSMDRTARCAGGRLSKKLLANGAVTIAETNLIPGRTLHDLPRI